MLLTVTMSKLVLEITIYITDTQRIFLVSKKSCVEFLHLLYYEFSATAQVLIVPFFLLLHSLSELIISRGVLISNIL